MHARGGGDCICQKAIRNLLSLLALRQVKYLCSNGLAPTPWEAVNLGGKICISQPGTVVDYNRQIDTGNPSGKPLRTRLGLRKDGNREILIPVPENQKFSTIC